LHPSTTAHTFEAARILMDTGFNWTLLHENLYTKSLNEKKLEIYLSKKIVYDTNNQIAHLIIPKGIHKRFNVPNACSMIYLLSDVKEMNAWISIYYDEELKVWKGSIRSRRFDVATVASKYNGGGHKLAAGFKLTKISDFHKIITDLILAVKTK
jgi:phosphoesterase RecJ-like protein